jgi:hypothetical protein
MNRLVVRLALVLLALSLLPLGGVGWVTLRLIERSVTAQVRSNQETLGDVAKGSLRLYMETARGKLRTIAAILNEQPGGKGGKFSPERLNALLEPPDIFVELGVYRARAIPSISATRARNRSRNTSPSSRTSTRRSSWPTGPTRRCRTASTSIGTATSATSTRSSRSPARARTSSRRR